VLNIQVFSDLHLEFGNPLPPVAAEYCIAAGDICAFSQIAKTLETLCECYRQVFYVPGNHEYFGSDFLKVEALLVDLESKLPGLCYLRPGQKTSLKTYEIIGCTLWYGGDSNPLHVEYIRRCMVDLRQIKGTSYEALVELGKAHRRWLALQMTSKTIVVTHHLPSQLSISPRFRNSPINGAFLNDCSEDILVSQPAAWVHGHTHDCFDYWIEGTHVLCNPMGYPGEGTPFDDACLLTLPLIL